MAGAIAPDFIRRLRIFSVPDLLDGCRTVNGSLMGIFTTILLKEKKVVIACRTQTQGERHLHSETYTHDIVARVNNITGSFGSALLQAVCRQWSVWLFKWH
jgi:hypothetical protein